MFENLHEEDATQQILAQIKKLSHHDNSSSECNSKRRELEAYQAKRKEQVENLKYFYQKIVQNNSVSKEDTCSIPIYVLNNKSDLRAHEFPVKLRPNNPIAKIKHVEFETELKNLVDKYDGALNYEETSAKTGKNIKFCIDKIIRLAISSNPTIQECLERRKNRKDKFLERIARRREEAERRLQALASQQISEASDKVTFAQSVLFRGSEFLGIYILCVCFCGVSCSVSLLNAQQFP